MERGARQSTLADASGPRNCDEAALFVLRVRGEDFEEELSLFEGATYDEDFWGHVTKERGWFLEFGDAALKVSEYRAVFILVFVTFKELELVRFRFMSDTHISHSLFEALADSGTRLKNPRIKCVSEGDDSLV